MSCPKTEHLLSRYLAGDMTPLAREELFRHLADCEYCGAEMRGLDSVQRQLGSWNDERVPHWDRGLELFRREHRVPKDHGKLPNLWQWLPTATSIAMLCLLLLNTSLVNSDQGLSVTFGSRLAATEIEAELAGFADAQRAEMQALIARFEQRQDNNNVQLLQAVMEQTQQTTAENLEQIYTYFEQQRLQDLQAMRASYEQLVDSDYETIRSIEQLAQYVSYQGDLR
mgnify:CR=1 FL=1